MQLWLLKSQDLPMHFCSSVFSSDKGCEKTRALPGCSVSEKAQICLITGFNLHIRHEKKSFHARWPSILFPAHNQKVWTCSSEKQVN